MSRVPPISAGQILTGALFNEPMRERRARSYPHELSGGMAKRVVIAMAMICEAELLIADELAGGLDVTIQAQILEDVRRLIRERGVSGLLITRDLGVVAHYCDSVAVLESGRIVEHSPVSRFFVRQGEHGRRLLEAFRYATESRSTDGRRMSRADVGAGRSGVRANLVSVRGLSKVFEVQGGHRIVAVDGVSFDLREGETASLMPLPRMLIAKRSAGHFRQVKRDRFKIRDATLRESTATLEHKVIHAA